MSLLSKQPQLLGGEISATKVAPSLEDNERTHVSLYHENSKKECQPPRWPERFRIPDSKVEDVAMSPNEDWLAIISSSQRYLKLYHRCFGYYSCGGIPTVRNVRGICFAAPSFSDRPWMMSYSNTEIVLWDLSVWPPARRRLGKEQRRRWHRYSIAYKPVFSLDGKYVAVCKKDFRYGYVYNVWFTRDGTCVRQWPCTTLVDSISIQSNEVDGGYHLAVFGGSSKIMTLWDLELDTDHRSVDSTPSAASKRSPPPYIEVKITYRAEEARRNLNVDGLGNKCGIQFEDKEGKMMLTVLRTEDGILQRLVSSCNTTTVDPTHKIVRYFYSEGQGMTKRLVEQSYIVFGSLQDFLSKERKKTGGKRIRLVLLDDTQDRLDVIPKPSWCNGLGCIWRIFHLFSTTICRRGSQQHGCIVVVPPNFQYVSQHLQDDYCDQFQCTTTASAATSRCDKVLPPALADSNSIPVKLEPVGEDFVDVDGGRVSTTTSLPVGDRAVSQTDYGILCHDKQPDVVKFAPHDDSDRDLDDDNDPGNGNNMTTLKVKQLKVVYKTYPRSILKKGSKQCPPSHPTTTKSLQNLVDAVRRQQHQEKHGLLEERRRWFPPFFFSSLLSLFSRSTAVDVKE